jgi:hypothetical protein
MLGFDMPGFVIKPGGYLFIQMGHNDQKQRGEGIGAFTSYKADLERFGGEARRHGATCSGS